jgi:signal transduction histidine kinase
VDVVTLVQDVAATLAPVAYKRGITLQTRYDSPMPRLWSDGPRMRQVLLNLIDNAIKFTSDGGQVLIEATTSTLDRDEQGEDGEPIALFSTPTAATMFSVSDTGVGIPDAAKTRVFDAFYQGDSSSTRAVGGTGLGLSIVKRLVEAHSGTVHVKDNVPQGSVFIVKIPRKSPG